MAASCNERTIRGVRTHVRFASLNIAGSSVLVALAWGTIVVHTVLMIALAWRFAFADAYSALGAGILSALMMGFLGAGATVLKSLGRPAQSRPAAADEQQDALLLFPSENPAVFTDSAATRDDRAENDLEIAPRTLATRRKALL